MIDPASEFEASLDEGTAFYSDGSISIVLDTGDDDYVLVVEKTGDLDTDDLDAILAEANICRVGDWYTDELGALAAPVLVGVRPDEEFELW